MIQEGDPPEDPILLEDLFETAPIGIHWTTLDGRLLRANPAELSLLGYERHEYVGRFFQEFYVHSDEAKSDLARLRRREALRNHPATLRARDGSPRSVLLNAAGLWVDDRFVYTRCFTRDVGAIGSSLLEARREQALRNAVLDGTTDIVFAKDLSGHYILANRAMERFFGKGQDEILGKHVTDILAPEEAVRIMANDRRVEETGVPSVFDEILVGTSGQRLFQTTKAPLRGDHGEVLGVVGVARDITEQKRHEESEKLLLQASQILDESLHYEATLANLVRLIVPKIADWCGLHVVEPDGSFRLVTVAHLDPRKVKLLECLLARYPPGPEEPYAFRRVLETGKPFLVPDIPEARLRALARSEEHLAILKGLGIRSHMCVPLLARNKIVGALSLAMAESERRFGEPELLLAQELARRSVLAMEKARLYRDVQRELAERQRLEGERARLNEMLERSVETRTAELAKAIQELRSFSYTVAHDLRAPLRSMSAFCDILEEDYAGKPLDASAHAYLRGIRESSQRMDFLIQGLLAYYEVARTEISVEAVDLGEAIRRALLTLSQEIAERGAVIQVETPLPSVSASEQTLADVLTKLLSNAIKFVPRGTPPRVRVWAETRESRVCLSVSDNGIGIPPEYHDRIFGVFERLHRMEDYPGAGIGLAIAKKAIERMGGKVGVESNPNAGSRFWIELPKAPTP